MGLNLEVGKSSEGDLEGGEQGSAGCDKVGSRKALGDYLWEPLWKNIKYGSVFSILFPYLSGKQYLIV